MLSTLTLTTADLRPVASDDDRVTPRAERPRRRAFTAEYKLQILAEYEALNKPGAKGRAAASGGAVLLASG